MSVKLRKKKTKKGESLYLDIYHDGQREYEFLKIHLTKDKESNKEKMRIAESIRAKKELEILSSSNGLTPKFKKNANFVEYFERFANENKSTTNYINTLNHLKKFDSDNIQKYTSKINIIEKLISLNKKMIGKIENNEFQNETEFTSYLNNFYLNVKNTAKKLRFYFPNDT